VRLVATLKIVRAWRRVSGCDMALLAQTAGGAARLLHACCTQTESGCDGDRTSE